jgi:hypothetical protein
MSISAYLILPPMGQLPIVTVDGPKDIVALVGRRQVAVCIEGEIHVYDRAQFEPRIVSPNPYPLEESP